MYIKIIGAWLLLDSLISLALYWDKKEETLIKNHLIRFIRLILGIVLILGG